MTSPQSAEPTDPALTAIGRPSLTATLWAINLASISASVLVYIYLADYAYRELRSLVLSEFVLFAPMVMPVVLAFQLNQIASRVEARTLLLRANLIGVAICSLLFLGIPLTTWSILLGAGTVGTLDAIQRVARIVAIKRYFSPKEVRFTVPLTLTAQFIAGAIAGGIVAFFPGQITTEIAAGATITLMTTAAACALLLPRALANAAPSSTPALSLRDCVALLKGNPALRESLISFVILCAFFQGFYSISRIALPAHHLGLGQSYVGLLQMVASLSAITGALSFYFASRRKFEFRVPYVYASCAAAMLLSCMLPGIPGSFASYFVYFFFFEIAFFRLQAEIMASATASEMPLVATIQYAMVYAGMLLTIGVGAILVDRLGLPITALLFVVVFYLCNWTLKAIFSPTSSKDQSLK